MKLRDKFENIWRVYQMSDKFKEENKEDIYQVFLDAYGIGIIDKGVKRLEGKQGNKIKNPDEIMKDKINKSNQDLIKEKLMKGCGKNTTWCNISYRCGEMEDLKHSGHIIYCKGCKTKLQQHEETKKAERNKIMDLIDKRFSETNEIDKAEWDNELKKESEEEE